MREGDPVNVVGWDSFPYAPYWDGPATVVRIHDDGYITVRSARHGAVGAFERKNIEKAAPDIANPLDMDEFIEHWGARLEQMYAERTAGDNSFTGFVASLLLDLQHRGVQVP